MFSWITIFEILSCKEEIQPKYKKQTLYLKSNYRNIYLEIRNWLLYVYCKHTSKRKVVIEHIVIWNTFLVCKLILHNQHSTAVVQELFTFLK